LETQTVDLRNLMIMINEKKGLNAQLALEFDCTLEVEDIEPLVKVINYSINYIQQLANKPLQISLYSGFNENSLVFQAFTSKSDFPALSEKVSEAMTAYKGTINFDGEPGKYAQIQLKFKKEEET
jgi:hypothetical protein